jgi:hypothetical protein
MGAKITFDASEREFVVTQAPVDGVITIDVNVDLYSDGKEDWQDDGTFPDLAKMQFPIDAIGGNQFGAKTLGASYLIKYGWHFKPFEADHTMLIVGNIGTETGWELVQDTVGTFRVRIENEVSTLVEVSETGVSGLTAEESAQITRIDAGIFGQKILRISTNPATLPGYMLLYGDEATPVLIGHKELWDDELFAVGWSDLQSIYFEGRTVLGPPP